MTERQGEKERMRQGDRERKRERERLRQGGGGAAAVVSGYLWLSGSGHFSPHVSSGIGRLSFSIPPSNHLYSTKLQAKNETRLSNTGMPRSFKEKDKLCVAM